MLHLIKYGSNLPLLGEPGHSRIRWKRNEPKRARLRDRSVL